MTNLGLRITLQCILEDTLDNGSRILFACLNCRFEDRDDMLGIWLMEASSKEGKPLGRFYRLKWDLTVDCWDDEDVVGSPEPKPTVLHIIQPTSGLLLRPPTSAQPLPCSLNYDDLFKAGYVVEGHCGPSARPLYKDNSKIIFELGGGFSSKPWIIFFKHTKQIGRFWVAICADDDNIQCTIESDVDHKDSPESIFGEEESHLTFLVDHSTKKLLYDHEVVNLTVKRALIWNRVGYMMKIAVHRAELGMGTNGDYQGRPMEDILPGYYHEDRYPGLELNREANRIESHVIK